MVTATSWPAPQRAKAIICVAASVAVVKQAVPQRYSQHAPLAATEKNSREGAAAMVMAHEAKIVSLQEYAAVSAPGRPRRRREDNRRCPPSSTRPSGDAHPDDQAAAAVCEIGQAQRFPVAARPQPDTLSSAARRIAAVAGFMRRRLGGAYDVDEFGFDKEFHDAIVMSLLRPLYRGWFRVEVTGIDNLPEGGPALVVANHAGVLPLDALMMSVAVHDTHPHHRPLRVLAADLVFDLPVLGSAARRAGHTLACGTDAHRLLTNGELTAVFPEGYKGLGKCFKDRYRLQRFGRGGFVTAALRTGAPIIPCSVIGSEEIYPMLGDVRAIARLLGLPYCPLTALFPLAGPLGLVPLPSKWHIDFGPPIPMCGFGSGAAEDPMLVCEIADHVRQRIQQTLYRRLAQRRNVFLG
jgi:1-acyl-sn-glycerol-3-phosphate acyltransferase